MAVLEELEAELATETRSALPGMVGGVSRGAVGRRRKKKRNALDEVTEEVAAEPEPERPMGVLEQVRLETETDPENVRRMRAEGQKLSTEQQKIAFKAERERPLTDVLVGAAMAYYPAAWNTIGQLAKGTAKFAVEGVGKPLGNAVLSGLLYEPGSDEQEKAMRDSLGGAYDATRSLASGVAQDIEETSNAAIRAGMFGTSITDLAAEKSGLISEDQAFNNYLSREEMRRGEAEDARAYPDRASTLLARNPLAGAVINSANIFSGRGDLTPEAKQAAVKDFEQTMLQQASEFTPDEDLSLLGEVLSPVGLPARAVMPVTRALGGAMEATGGAAVRAVTKPTIGGVNPLEGVGIGIRKIGEGAEAAGAKVSEMITGRPDTFLAAPGTVVSAFTKRPGQLVESSGKFLRDIGRQIDEGGIRGRTGIIERLGRDPNSSAWVQDLFGAGSQKRLDRLARKNKKRIEAGKEALKPGRGGVLRAKTADYGMRLANSLSKAGVSGAALNGILGAADVETAEEFGYQTGVGYGIGNFMGARVPERIGAVLDPTLDLRSKIDRVIETDPLDRRLDEEADLKRFRATADPELVRRAEMIASPDELIASRLKELDGLFQMKAESEYAEEDTTELDGRITSMVDGINQLREQTKNLSQADLDERRRMVELDIADNLDVLRSNHSVAGLNNVDVNLLRGDEMAGWLRDKWGQTLERAEAVVGQFDGAADLSDAENQTLMLAKKTVEAFNAELLAFTGSPTKAPVKGAAFDPREKVEAHLVRAGVTVPTIVINADAAMKDPRGFRHSMLHEGNHALRQFQEVREMQQPMYEFLFGKKAGIPDDQGNRMQVTPGIITDEFIDNILTPLYFGGAPTMNFDSVEARREYIRDEVMSEVSGISEGGARTIREVLDSPGQAVVDRLLISQQNSILGRLRAALELAGVELDSLGNVKSVLFGQAVSNASMPEVLAMMRQFKRQQLEYTDTMVFASQGTRENVNISVTELMTNRALQEAYKDDVNWVHEVVLDVRDENGDSVVQIPLPEDSAMNAAVGEYRIVNGQLVDENGTVLPIDSSVNLAGLPDNSRASVENRIARNVDGSPKILTNKEIESRARQRDQMIKDAIDNAPDDGSPTRLRDTGNGYYVGIPSPSQLDAIRELPNTLVTPYVKKNLLDFIKVLQRRDGTRILMEYQPALKKGKYRALSPKIRDVAPIGFRFTKAGNWLAVNVSVSRMFEKLDLWAREKPENLDLWGRSPARFMDDVLRVLDNHNKNLAGQTNLDIDPDIALQKKNRVNDFFNMFTKDTEAANPSRTKLKARRGQESADRILMSARIDRINQMQISNAQKFPVDYGKMKINFLPGQPNGELRLDPSQDLEVENDLGLEVGPGARFLPGIRYTDLPDDPKKTMADFYMLNAMITTPPTGWSLGKFGGEATMYSPSADPTGRYAGVRAEKYQDALDEAKQTLIPTLHSKITKALQFAVAAELRHALARKQPDDLASTEFYQEYARQYAVQGADMPDLKKDRAPGRYKSENEGYKKSFVAMENARKKLGMSVADVARFAEQLYRRGSWSSSYGGKPWGDIAQHLAKMSEPEYSTEKVRAVVTDPETGRMQMIETDEFRDPGAYSQMFQEIDRAYDLQHNTNTVFNKLKKYYLGSEGYGWIAKMLDFKANVGNPRELRGLVSGTMGRLADAWFADMRADAPLTQDLEEKVKAQLPENLIIPDDSSLSGAPPMNREKFIDVLKALVGSYYRKSSSGVRRENPYENIANAAEGIHRNLGRGNDAWKEIKKDQNAHIGLILEDSFGDLGIAKTDAVKLFRMLLNEGTDPRVTGKPATRTPLNVPKPEKPFPDITTGTLKAAAQSIINGYLTNPGKNEGVVLGNHNLFLEVNQANEFVLMAQPFLSGGTFGSPFVVSFLKTPAELVSEASTSVKIGKAITEFGNSLAKTEGIPAPAAAGTAISPGDLLSVDKIGENALKIVANWNTETGLSDGHIDMLGHRFYLAPTGTSNPGFADLTARKKNASGPAYGPPIVIKTVLMSSSSAKQVADAIQEFQDGLTTFTPADAPSGQYFIGGKTFVPNQKQSAPTNLKKFADTLWDAGTNGLKIGDITVVNAGVKEQAVVLKVYQGDSVAEKDLKTTVEIPVGPPKSKTYLSISEATRDMADWLANYGMMKAKEAGYTNLMGWMAQDLSGAVKTPAPKMSPELLQTVLGLPQSKLKIVNDYITSLETDQEFVDANLNNLPPSNIDKGLLFVKNTFPGIEKLTENKQMQFAKYLHDLGKWASDKLEKRKYADDGMDADVEEAGLTPDSPAVGYANPDGTLMTVAEAATTVGPFEAGEIGGTNHVYFTDNSGTAITNPYEDSTGDPLANEWTPGNKDAIMKFWADNGVLPSVSETALAIFDAANPGHPYSKEASGNAYSMDSIMEKANELGVLVYDVSYDGQAMPQTIILGDKDDGVTITKNGPQSNDYTFQGDDQNFAIGDLDTVLKAAAKYLKQKGLEGMDKKDEAAAQKQAMEFLDQMLLDDPFTIDGNVWELEGIDNDAGELAGAVVKLNGSQVSNMMPVDPESMTMTQSPEEIFNDYFALDWMKDWKAPDESGSLLTPSQDQMMVAASELVAALSGGYIAQPEVTIGGKNFSAKINEQGNMVVFGQDASGNLTGAIPITGSKNMDPIDLEAAVYEALDLLNAGAGNVVKAPAVKKPTETEIDEAADGLLNAGDGDSVTVGGYEFQTVLGGQGGAKVNILPEGTRDIIDTFYYDASDFDNPSDLLDVLFINVSQFFNNLPGQGPTAPGAKFMPGGGITPKTLYNFYHLATLESQGRIKSEYGQGLMREYLNIYKQRYLETLAPLVSDQIKKYIGRGRVDEPVTEESLNAAANDPVALDELMRQTYRSDMRRRNDVWNNITEHLRGLAAAGTARDIIFRIDRLNNAIHNTNELLFSKFKNAGELMDAFEAINDARDERAYSRNVDKDLRQIEEFEGGPGARFMPDVANAEDLTSAVASILSARNVRDDRAKKWLREAYRKNFVQLGLPQGRERASLADYRPKKSDPDWMRKPGLQSFKSLKAAEKDRVGHIADYLNTLDERELSKLPKQTLADIEKKVAEWDKMLQKKMGERAKFVNEGRDIETLETFEDGFRVVRLLSKGAYNDEGKCMGHCVGSYDPTEKNRTILSLRGPDGESHATLELVKDFKEYADEMVEDIQREGMDWDEMEGDFDEDIDYARIAEETFVEDHGISSIEDVVNMSKAVKKAKGGFIVQIKGKANKAPKKVYADRILRFIQNNSDRYVITGEGENLGLVKRGDQNQAPSGRFDESGGIRGVDGRGTRFLEPPEGVAWDPEGSDPENFINDSGLTYMSRFLGEDAFESYQEMRETIQGRSARRIGYYLSDLENFAQKKIADSNFFKTGRSRYPKAWSKEEQANFAEIENLDLESPKNWPKIANFLKKQFEITGNKNRREKIDLARYIAALVKLPAGEYKRRKPIMDRQRAAAEKTKEVEKTKIAAGPVAFRFYEEPAAAGGARFMPGNVSGSSQVDQSLAGVTAPDTDQGPLSGARFMPREVSGETAWRGSYLNEQRRHGADFGGGNYEAWRKNPFLKAFEKLGTTQVTYLAKDQDLAYDFAQQAKEMSYRGEPGLKKLRVEKYKIRGKSTKLFDPLDAEDREKVSKVLKKKRIPENFAKRALKEITAIDEYDGNWKSLEMLAPAIKEAGFDGYIAMETLEEETYGLFGDVAGMKDSMATPIRANSSGKNIQFMPGYNPRYTDDDGNFNFGLYSEDKRKAIAYLRDRRGITRKDFSTEDEWKRIIRETMRDVVRND